MQVITALFYDFFPLLSSRNLTTSGRMALRPAARGSSQNSMVSKACSHAPAPPSPAPPTPAPPPSPPPPTPAVSGSGVLDCVPPFCPLRGRRGAFLLPPAWPVRAPGPSPLGRRTLPKTRLRGLFRGASRRGRQSGAPGGTTAALRGEARHGSSCLPGPCSRGRPGPPGPNRCCCGSCPGTPASRPPASAGRAPGQPRGEGHHSPEGQGQARGRVRVVVTPPGSVTPAGGLVSRAGRLPRHHVLSQGSFGAVR